MSGQLEDLVVSGKELDRKSLAGTLAPYVKLDKDICNIRPLGGWDELKAYLKILTYLLARKAMMALDFDIEEEGATTSEVARDTGLKEGTVRPALRNLLSGRLVAQSKNRRYFVPNHAIEKIKTILSEE